MRKGRGDYALLHAYDTLTGDTIAKEAVLPPDESLTCINWCSVNNHIYIGSSSGDIKVLYSPASGLRNGILACIQKEPKRRKLDSLAASAFENDQMIFYPTEIMDEKQKEWEKKNPEAARRDPERTVMIRPEFYEQEL